MIEKLKVINLLTLLSENSIPKRFIWGDVLWIFDTDRRNYYADDKQHDVFWYMNMNNVVECLNDEIELLEEIVEPEDSDGK